MPSELLAKQQRFVALVATLINWAYANGYALTLGEAYRTPQQAQWNAEHGKGIAKSLHTLRLAIDLNLFVNGEFRTDLESYRPLGEYWKTLDPLARWGGDFRDAHGNQNPDANHFSLTWDGRA